MEVFLGDRRNFLCGKTWADFCGDSIQPGASILQLQIYAQELFEPSDFVLYWTVNRLLACLVKLMAEANDGLAALTGISKCCEEDAYRSRRPPDVELRGRLRDLANERRRFGYSSNAKGRAFLDRIPLAPAVLIKFSHGNADALLKLRVGRH